LLLKIQSQDHRPSSYVTNIKTYGAEQNHPPNKIATQKNHSHFDCKHHKKVGHCLHAQWIQRYVPGATLFQFKTKINRFSKKKIKSSKGKKHKNPI